MKNIFEKFHMDFITKEWPLSSLCVRRSRVIVIWSRVFRNWAPGIGIENYGSFGQNLKNLKNLKQIVSQLEWTILKSWQMGCSIHLKKNQTEWNVIWSFVRLTFINEILLSGFTKMMTSICISYSKKIHREIYVLHIKWRHKQWYLYH